MPKTTVSKYDFTVYKNKPFIRCNNILYYGNISDNYVVKMEILEYKPKFNVEVPGKISVKLLSTEKNLKERNRILKKCERDGLYSSLDVADAWLNKVLSETKENK